MDSKTGVRHLPILKTSVAEPGCLSRIRIFPSWIPDPWSKRFRIHGQKDSGSRIGSKRSRIRIRIKEFKYFYLSSRKFDPGYSHWSSRPDLDPGSRSWIFTHPGSRGQKDTESRIRIRNTAKNKGPPWSIALHKEVMKIFCDDNYSIYVLCPCTYALIYPWDFQKPWPGCRPPRPSPHCWNAASATSAARSTGRTCPHKINGKLKPFLCDTHIRDGSWAVWQIRISFNLLIPIVKF